MALATMREVTMNDLLADARRLANEVHMDRSEWILAARRTIKALCDEARRLQWHEDALGETIQANEEFGPALIEARERGESLKAAILDIDAHATPLGQDEDGNVAVGYAVSVGSLHRALGLVGHGSAKCEQVPCPCAEKAEAQRDAWRQMSEQLALRTRELMQWGVEFDDSRLSYVSVQVSHADITDAEVALVMFDRLVAEQEGTVS